MASARWWRPEPIGWHHERAAIPFSNPRAVAATHGMPAPSRRNTPENARVEPAPMRASGRAGRRKTTAVARPAAATDATARRSGPEAAQRELRAVQPLLPGHEARHEDREGHHEDREGITKTTKGGTMIAKDGTKTAKAVMRGIARFRSICNRQRNPQPATRNPQSAIYNLQLDAIQVTVRRRPSSRPTCGS
jgi:hypothetical protein